MATSATQRHLPRRPAPAAARRWNSRARSPRTPYCGYCQSTVVRSGEVLTRLGKMAELFDDHSPLQLLASGRIALDGQDQPFTLIGRLQYKGDAGIWTEWAALLARRQHRPRWAEDNGAYVFTRPHRPWPRAARGRALSPRGHHRHQRQTAIAWPIQRQAQLIVCPGRAAPNCRRWANRLTWWSCAAADGEVAQHRLRPYPAQRRARPRSCCWKTCKLQGLKRRIGQGRKRPSVQLPALRRPGAGAAVHHQKPHLRLVQQPHRPERRRGRRAALRRAGRARAAPHPAGQQGPVAGCALAGGGLSAPHGRGARRRSSTLAGANTCSTTSKRGFAFLVDSEEGWSMVRPTTGAPQLSPNGRSRHVHGHQVRAQNTATGPKPPTCWASSTGR